MRLIAATMVFTIWGGEKLLLCGFNDTLEGVPEVFTKVYGILYSGRSLGYAVVLGLLLL
jgi:hypothetical protein